MSSEATGALEMRNTLVSPSGAANTSSTSEMSVASSKTEESKEDKGLTKVKPNTPKDKPAAEAPMTVPGKITRQDL